MQLPAVFARHPGEELGERPVFDGQRRREARGPFPLRAERRQAMLPALLATAYLERIARRDGARDYPAALQCHAAFTYPDVGRVSRHADLELRTDVPHLARRRMDGQWRPDAEAA